MDESLTLTKLSSILNLSKGTISKSLNDSDEISVTIKERVRKMAATYNYSPNENAYGLSPQRRRTIGNSSFLGRISRIGKTKCGIPDSEKNRWNYYSSNY